MLKRPLLIILLFVAGLPQPARANCSELLELYLDILFVKSEPAKFSTPSYLLQESKTHFALLGDFDIENQLGPDFQYESLLDWKLKLPELEDAPNGLLEIEVWNIKTKMMKIVRLQADRNEIAQKLFFSGLKLPGSFILKKSPAPDWIKKSSTLDESILAAVLYRSNQQTLKENSRFFLNALDRTHFIRRQIAILKGETSLSRVEDILRPFDGLSWSKVLKRSEQTEVSPDFITKLSHSGIEYLGLEESQLINGISDDDGIGLLLNQIRTQHERASQTFASSFSIRRLDGTKSNYHYLNGTELFSRKANTKSDQVVPDQWMNAPEDIRAYVDSRYQMELNLSPEQRTKLVEISREMESRTRFIFLAEEPFMKITEQSKYVWSVENQQVELHPAKKLEGFSHFKIQGSLSMVYAGPGESLPLEKFTDVKINRPATGKVVEIGRFTVNPELRPNGPKQIWKIVSLVASQSDVSKIVAQTAEPYAKELIERFGFSKVAERLNYEGKTEYIIEITPKTFFERSLLRSIN